MSESGPVRLPDGFDKLDTGVTLHDAETGAILDVNSKLVELYGYSREELRTMEVEEYTATTTTTFSQAAAVERIRAAADGESRTFERQVERSSGEVIWVSVHLTDLRVDGTTCVIAEIRDVTEYKTRERRLRLLNRVIRHNLRNDTTVLMGYADRLKDAVEEETLEEEIETILEIAEEIGTLSDSIEQFEEIADPNRTTRSRTSVNEMVDELAAAARAEYPAAEVTVDERTELWVNADRGLYYAIEHAIENAIVHNDRETPSVAVTIAEESETGRGAVRIADDGPTIPEMEVGVLQEEERASSTYHGSGIGLWVMQWCVDSLGGELVFAENDPRGNVVSMMLPLADPDDAT